MLTVDQITEVRLRLEKGESIHSIAKSIEDVKNIGSVRMKC